MKKSLCLIFLLTIFLPFSAWGREVVDGPDDRYIELNRQRADGSTAPAPQPLSTPQVRPMEKSGTKVPIILIHGFLGWGRDEMSFIKYWGGRQFDVAQIYRDMGFEVYEAVVGAISSNHDRACEAFYQIRGGRVDYGEEHAEESGHNRFGREYPGFVDRWDANNPVHIIGHSMGGQTARMLVELLARDYFGIGSTEEWVRSVTTISTPNQGTTLCSALLEGTGNKLEELLAAFLSFPGADLGFYNFDLDQWNLTKGDGEKRLDYIQRAVSTLGSTKDIASWDLSPQGAKALNEDIRTFDTVYYFSVSTAHTKKRIVNDHHVPKLDMVTIIRPTSKMMGKYEGGAVIDHELWYENDGVVNTVSMAGPDSSAVVDYSGGEARPGVWNHWGVEYDFDHASVVGLTVFLLPSDQENYLEKVNELYENIGETLKGLERVGN